MIPCSLDEIFSPNGPFAKGILGYTVRAQQIAMAKRIDKAIIENRVLVAEAGTGTGKTFAYLIPSFLSNGKVIISTGTKTLQDQLFLRDIPIVKKLLAFPVHVALLKGRANYLCHYYLERTVKEGRFVSREDTDDAARIIRFAKKTRTGDKADCHDVAENSPVWPMVTSTRESCLGQECSHYKECFILAARREAMAADVVVVNHHLFFADVILRDEGITELLPACNTVIFDEAHQLPETASLFFGRNMSTSQVIDLVRDVRNEGLISARDCLDLPVFLAAVDKSARDLRLTLPVAPERFSMAELDKCTGFDQRLADLVRTLDALEALLETQAERSEGLENTWRRTANLATQCRRWADGQEKEHVRWVETFSQSLQLNETPLVIAGIMQKQMSGHPRAWIFTSATLAVEGNFTHYCEEMGLATSESAYWDSPFDYQSQALLYVPMGMPDPNSYAYSEAVVRAAFPVIEASGGRTFFLCTSLRSMRRIHELLEELIEHSDHDFPLLVQGSASKNELLERFRRLGNAILVGSQSFWEGVDVRGDALSLVVIDKLPFAPPDDPVLSARIEHMKSEGRNAFMEYQLPRVVINVKQGAGRLIRDETDRGVLMICDPRLIARHYGKRIWRSLPPMKRTRELDEVLAFFKEPRS